jgi:hypothetical protein
VLVYYSRWGETAQGNIESVRHNLPGWCHGKSNGCHPAVQQYRVVCHNRRIQNVPEVGCSIGQALNHLWPKLLTASNIESTHIERIPLSIGNRIQKALGFNPILQGPLLQLYPTSSVHFLIIFPSWTT